MSGQVQRAAGLKHMAVESVSLLTLLDFNATHLLTLRSRRRDHQNSLHTLHTPLHHGVENDCIDSDGVLFIRCVVLLPSCFFNMSPTYPRHNVHPLDRRPQCPLAQSAHDRGA